MHVIPICCFCSVLGEKTSKKGEWTRKNLHQGGMQPGFQCQNCLPPAPRPQARHNLSRFGYIDWFTIKILASLILNCLTGEINITILVLPTSQRCPVVLKTEMHNPDDVLDAVQISCSVVSDSSLPHELQHARLPCSSPTPRACSNPCPSSQ